MAERQVAKRIIQQQSADLYTVEDAAKVIGYPSAIIRNWISRGYVKLRSSVQHGRGVGISFAFEDIVYLMIVAEFSRLSIGPQKSGVFSEDIMASVMHRIEDMAGVYGKNCVDDFERFYAIEYNKIDNCLRCILLAQPMQRVSPESDVLRIVVDCEEMAQKVINAFIFLGK